MPFAAAIPAIIGGIGVGGSIINGLRSSGAQGQVAGTAAREQALREQIYQQIAPFANMLVQWGIDPTKFLNSTQGQAILGQTLEPVGKEYDQARVNFVNSQMGSGFSPQAGTSAGPFANLLQSEAAAKSGARRDLVSQGLNMGMQGANLLQGQQAQFNPNALLSAMYMNPPSSGLGNILQSLGLSLPGLFSSVMQQHSLNQLINNQVGSTLNMNDWNWWDQQQQPVGGSSAGSGLSGVRNP